METYNYTSTYTNKYKNTIVYLQVKLFITL